MMIGEFAVNYLEEMANHPEVKQYYSIPEMKDVYSRHIERMNLPKDADFLMIRNLPDGREAAIFDRKHLLYLAESGKKIPKVEVMERFRPRNLRERFQMDPSIQVLGDKKGARYGHIKARPILNDQVVAEIITDLLEHNLGEYRWADLCTHVLQMLHDIHRKGAVLAKKEPEKIYNPRHRSRPNFDISLHQDVSISMSIDCPKFDGREGRLQMGKSSWYPACWPNEGDLEVWLEANYNERWFSNSTSNLQRIIKNEKQVISGSGANGNGLKRGLWMHSKHFKNRYPEALSKYHTMRKIDKATHDLFRLTHDLDPTDEEGRHRIEYIAKELQLFSSRLMERIEESRDQ